MKLEDIGFYTLSDFRVAQTSEKSPLWRCELLLTSKCNFNCTYCRGTKSDADISLSEAKSIIDYWSDNYLKNIRFSGGEPTLVSWLPDICSYARSRCISRIAVSTNGSANREVYASLLKSGVNDFSVSLDSCCSIIGDRMSGTSNMWNKVIGNIRYLSKRTYVTVGVVITDDNIEELENIIYFASDLGVSDIRIITAAQFGNRLDSVEIDSHILNRHPILKYRVENLKRQRDVRGIVSSDSHRCALVLDDMVVRGNQHYPCVIQMREGGLPIGVVGENTRKTRKRYFLDMDTHKDPICKKNCLDVCVDYNNKYINQG